VRGLLALLVHMIWHAVYVDRYVLRCIVLVYRLFLQAVSFGGTEGHIRGLWAACGSSLLISPLQSGWFPVELSLLGFFLLLFVLLWPVFILVSLGRFPLCAESLRALAVFLVRSVGWR
jgi:hypothetical protein